MLFYWLSQIHLPILQAGLYVIMFDLMPQIWHEFGLTNYVYDHRFQTLFLCIIKILSQIESYILKDLLSGPEYAWSLQGRQLWWKLLSFTFHPSREYDSILRLLCLLKFYRINQNELWVTHILRGIIKLMIMSFKWIENQVSGKKGISNWTIN